MSNSSRYDVIIIGSGLGGLACGATLSKEGYNVCVLEKNPLPGGCFQSFKRYGRMLDTGIHYIGSMDEGEIMRQYFTYFGIMDKLKMRRMDEEAFDMICYKDKFYPFAMGHERFAETLTREFPKEKDALYRYVDMLDAVGRSISVEQLRKGKLSSGNMDNFYVSAWEQIRGITPDETLRQVLSGSVLLYGGDQSVSTFYHHAIITNSYLQGAWRFVDGSMQVADALVGMIRQNGGTVLTGAEVSKLYLSGNEIKAVEINHSEQLESRYVISSLHPFNTLSLVEKSPLIRKATLSRLQHLPNSYGLFSVYLLQKRESTRYYNRNLFLLGDQNAWYNTRYPEDTRINTCMVSMQPSSAQEQYTDVICLLSPMYLSEVKNWEDTTVGRRGADYEEFKMQKAQQLMAFAERYCPGISQNTEKIVTTTPLTYRDYTGTPDGSAYGIMKNYKNPLITLIPPRTRISNLFLTGQSLNVHGALGVTLTSMLTCAELLGSEYLARKIGDA
ncbi:NAD(P)/FAD-dependent oxidoreductase [uncultured Parabacteroides sp.]|uniref:phytoene desaturase family protein n=1 Tax=uncultured Parabacteroides sp. TaxID=512312 RepID=UPI002584AE70|nr:NAD(P)/FAD-dependent oxidoreductase [uncultured Parabacteroides sp.]